ncbi:MAG: GNAT family N-acetyltransferase [Chitinophagaceae bacterium]|nr:MAG: GNAT family N-acetyltransferase [Chitinophagaceae bacterium]
MIQKVLENPIWHALNSGNSKISEGNSNVRYFPAPITTFVGLKEFTAANFLLLSQMLEGSCVRATFVWGEVPDTAPWSISAVIECHQMILKDEVIIGRISTDLAGSSIKPLGLQNVSEMLALTRLSNPGHFTERTVELGNYFGMYEGDLLVGMAGYRLQLDEYTEISAVCTHPGYFGKGIAKALVSHQVNCIRAAGKTPVLHVKTDNQPALKLYESLGFVITGQMKVIIFRK